MTPERLGYDAGTKIWTSITGLFLAGIVDWVTTIMPVRNHPPTDPGIQGWLFALIIAMTAPTAWAIGYATRREWNTTVVWGVAIVSAVVFQLCVLTWSRAQL